MLPKPLKPKKPPQVPPSDVICSLEGLNAELANLSLCLRGNLDSVVQDYSDHVDRLLARCALPAPAPAHATAAVAAAGDDGAANGDGAEAWPPGKGGSPDEAAAAAAAAEHARDFYRGMSATFSEDERSKEQMSRSRTGNKCTIKNRLKNQGTKTRLDTTEPYQVRLQRYLKRLVTSRYFEIFFCCIILLNTVYFGIEAEVLAQDPSVEESGIFEIISGMFSAVFTVELLLRIMHQGRSFFCTRDSGWNIFDTVIVGVSLVETLILFIAEAGTSRNLTSVRMIRLARTFRILRIIRIITFFQPLRLLLLSVLSTLRSLFWTVLLLMLMLYMFGVLFTQATTGHLAGLQEGHISPEEPGLRTYYGSVGRSVYTLFKAITNGVDWEMVVAPLTAIHWSWVTLFVLYIAFAYFAVLNVVTGVFCQTAIESAIKDQEEVMQAQESSKAAYIEQLTELFQDVDTDGSGELTIDEFEDLLADERLQKYCASLDITIDDAWALFKLLDTDGSGAIGVEEFVTGCLRLQGSARGVDLALASYQLRWIITRFTTFTAYTDKQFSSLRTWQESSKELMQALSAVNSLSPRSASPGQGNALWNPGSWRGPL